MKDVINEFLSEDDSELREAFNILKMEAKLDDLKLRRKLMKLHNENSLIKAINESKIQNENALEQFMQAALMDQKAIDLDKPNSHSGLVTDNVIYQFLSEKEK